MPDLTTRRNHEEEIAAALLLVFAEWKDRPFDGEAFGNHIIGALTGTLASVYTEAGRQFIDQFAHGIDPNVTAANAKRWEIMFLPILAAEIASTTEPGRIGAFSPARAEMAAITEVTRAISAAEFGIAGYLATVDDPGLRKVLRSVWYTALDERVCPICEPLHGLGKEEWGKAFPLGPPAHPRCRCSLQWSE